MTASLRYTIPLAAFSVLLATIAFGRIGDLLAYVMVALMVTAASVLFTTQLSYRLIGIAAIAFAVAQTLEFYEQVLAAGAVSIVGYFIGGIGIARIRRKRTKKIEPSVLLEGGAIAAIAVMAIIVVSELLSSTVGNLAIQFTTLVVTLVILASFMGRKRNMMTSALVFALVAAVILELFDAQIPVAHYNRIWALVWLPVLFGFGLPQSVRELQPAPISARRAFGRFQQLMFAGLQFAPMILVAAAAVAGLTDSIATLAGLGVAGTGFVVLRFRLLIDQRDWSYNQEQKLRSYGQEIISSNGQADLDSTTLRTLNELTNDVGRVAILENVDGDLVVIGECSPKLNPPLRKASSRRRKVVSFGNALEETKSWFDPDQNGGSQVATQIPGHESTPETSVRYLVAAVPKTAEADLEDHFRSAATQYGLALRANALAAQIQEERANNRFNALAQDSNDLIFVVGGDHAIKFVGPTAERLLGYPNDSYEGSHVLTHMSKADREVAKATLTRTLAPGENQVVDVRLQLANGATRWFEMSARNLDDQPELDGTLVSFSDINDRKLAGLNLRNSEARFRAMVQNSVDVSMLVGKDLTVMYVSPNIESMFNLSTEDLVGSSLLGFVDETSHAVLADLIERSEQSDVPLEAEVKMRGALGASSRLTEISVANSNLGQDDSFVITVRDITTRRQLEDDLRSKALYDDLTGLLNRSAFVYETQACLQRLRKGDLTAVVSLNLRNFKELNDSAGFAVGDKVLNAVASRLRSLLREGDNLARLSADEFAASINIANKDQASDLADKLKAVFTEPFAIDQREHLLGASVGATWTQDRRKSAADLIQQSTVAMHKAKGAPSAEVVVFDESMQRETADRFELGAELRGAVTNGDFSLVFQPLISLGSNSVYGFEALLRWNHPERGNISPGVFIPLAEENGMIVEIGRWVLQEACKQLATWKQAFPEFANCAMSVNLSARQLENENELNGLVDIVTRSGIRPRDLIIELTESTMIDDAARISAELSSLRDMDIKIAIDDFGTGVSGLNHLRELPVDSVKIDKSYIDKIGVTNEGTQLVSQIIDLAQAMGAYIVAEGIETPEQSELLVGMGCDVGQGFYLARPMAAAKVLQWMQSRHVGDLVTS